MNKSTLSSGIKEGIISQGLQEFDAKYQPVPKTYKISPFTYVKSLNKTNKFRSMQKFYIEKLASHMTEGTYACRASQRTIATEMGVSVRTVATIQREYEQAGIIRKRFNYKKNGHRGVSTIILSGALEARDYVDQQQQARLKAEARQRLELEYKEMLNCAPQHQNLLNEAASSPLMNTRTLDISWKIGKEETLSTDNNSYYKKPFIVDWLSFRDWIQAIQDKVSRFARKISKTCLRRSKCDRKMVTV